MVPVIRCRLCRATRVNGQLPTLLGKLGARDGVLLVPVGHLFWGWKTHQDTLCKEELFSRPDQLSNSQTQFLVQFDSICRFSVAVAFVIDGTCLFANLWLCGRWAC